MQTPSGLEEICTMFGDIRTYIDETGVLSPFWNEQKLTVVTLPFPIPLSWNLGMTVSRMTCHKLTAQLFQDVFTTIQQQGLQSAVKTFGGCFNFRQQRTGAKLSTHAWGIAIDINPGTNGQGTHGDMDPGIVAIFKQFGFTYGGDWPLPRTDAMHFQFATGY